MKNQTSVRKKVTIDSLIDLITLKLNDYLHLEGFEFEELKVGVSILIINIMKFIVLLCVAIALNILKEALIVFFLFFLVRMNSFGLHAKNSLVCTVVSLTFIIGTALVSKILIIDTSINILLYIIAVSVLIKYSPADTENRPLIGEEVRRACRKKTIITTIVLISINIILSNNMLNNMLLFAIIFQDICILPISYKILGRRYNNYEEYEE